MARKIKVKDDIEAFTSELLSFVSTVTAFALFIPADILLTLLGVINIIFGNVDVGIIIIVISNLVAILLCVVAFIVLAKIE